MIEGLAAIAPRLLAPYCRAVRTDGLHQNGDVDAAAIDAALKGFADGFWQPDPLSLASLWSMYYFNALIIPATTALLCQDRILPVALSGFRLSLDAKATPSLIHLPHAGRLATSADHGRRFMPLVVDHLDPFIRLYAAQTRLAPRVLWSNAASIVDYVVGMIASDAVPEVRREGEALLAGTAPGPDAVDRVVQHLAGPYRIREDDTRERKTCCMRHRLSGIGRCSVICPMRDAF